jgi:glycosyltransferase involved in cell wall biosynthesis
MPGGDGPIGWKRRIAEHLLARESPPAAIAAYSHDGLDALHRRGIRSPIEQVVPPGVDCGRFRFLPEQAVAIRRELGVPPDTALIGHVGRLHPVKDHPLLLRGFGMISGQPHLVCVGDGDAGYAEKLRALAAAIGVAARVHWWPHREDMAAVYSAIDALAVPSYSEGGPLVVAEAMACGTPCVVTRVGTASEFVGTLGGILTERTPQALASAIQTLLESVPSGQACRSRIQSHFSLERMSQATLELFERVV